jgi:hypothetical protein
MGRFVFVVLGDLDWCWKFWFARQCSNFGAIMETVDSEDIEIARYIGDDGEYVRIYADKNKLVEKLKNLEVDECPVCRNIQCLEATREMIRDFAEAIEKYNNEEIHVTLFVEYV